MDIVTGVSLVDRILNIKDKLFKKKTESTTTENVTTKIECYCSVFLEHSYAGEFSDANSLELILSKKSDFTIPIRRLDWVILENQLDYVKVKNIELDELFLVEKQGLFLVLETDGILQDQIRFHGLEGKSLKKALKKLELQITYADGYQQRVPSPELLKDYLFSKLNQQE
jgi:hypothetical protein